MTPKERLLTVLRREIPDCVPVMPDFSNMIPAKLTAKPFWDLYLYNDPPIWEAYVECAKYFNIDSLMDGYFPLGFRDPDAPPPEDDRFIVFRSEERIITQRSRFENGKRTWAKTVDVYYVADPPTTGVPPAKIGLPAEPEKFEPLEGVKPVDTGPEGLKRMKQLMGDQGLIGVWGGVGTCALGGVEDVYDYYDHPQKYDKLAEDRIGWVERRMAQILALEVKPDFVCFGGSGSLIWQTPDILRRISLPAVKRGTEIATANGLPSQVHSCGPEAELVKIMAENTSLTVIDPLEVPPMGDCDLAELKRLYGDRLVLKGNLHTTSVMLYGSVDDVIAASKKAIDDGAEGGGFILATGDQCGRDTPFENLHAMIETARTYGRY